tara:strand:+ start:474 stop:839 length:366 start_codon:yes stop_codon:yes gene_type:complete
MAITKRQIKERLEKKRFWQSHLEACQSSGQSKPIYCKEHGLSINRFRYWQSKLLATDKEVTSNIERQDFLEVQVCERAVPDSESKTTITIRTPAGFEVDIPSDSQGALFIKVFKALKDASC